MGTIFFQVSRRKINGYFILAIRRFDAGIFKRGIYPFLRFVKGLVGRPTILKE